MITNDIKKGTFFRLSNGFDAKMLDNKKGNIRLAEVNGLCREMGSIYGHDIAWVWLDSAGKTFENCDECNSEQVHMTATQTQCRKMVRSLGF